MIKSNIYLGGNGLEGCYFESSFSSLEGYLELLISSSDLY